jgi:hypothetical protein
VAFHVQDLILKKTAYLMEKFGCFPFVIYEAAKRFSKNRRARILEMKPMDSIKRVSTESLIDKVLPAIRAKWP